MIYIKIIYFSCDQAALWTVQSVRPSVCSSVFHTFLTLLPSSYHHEIFRSYYQWQKSCPCKRSGSEVKGQGLRGQNPIWPFPDHNSSLNSHMMMRPIYMFSSNFGYSTNIPMSENSLYERRIVSKVHSQSTCSRNCVKSFCGIYIRAIKANRKMHYKLILQTMALLLSSYSDEISWIWRIQSIKTLERNKNSLHRGNRPLFSRYNEIKIRYSENQWITIFWTYNGPVHWRTCRQYAISIKK